MGRTELASLPTRQIRNLSALRRLILGKDRGAEKIKTVILAGGKGTRLAPYSHVFPKPLMPIGDRPILEILLSQLRRADITDIVLTVGHLSELIRSYFGDGERFDVKLTYSYEDKPLGTAGPLSLVRNLDHTFLVCNGDLLSNMNLRNLLKYHRMSDAVATISTFDRVVEIDFGVMTLADGSREIANYVEKPSYTFHVSMGIYVFEPDVLDFIPKNEYLDFPDLVLKLVKANKKVMSFPFDGYWKDIGRVEDYEAACKDFEEKKIPFMPYEDGI